MRVVGFLVDSNGNDERITTLEALGASLLRASLAPRECLVSILPSIVECVSPQLGFKRF